MNPYKNNKKSKQVFGTPFLSVLATIFILIIMAIAYCGILNQQNIIGTETKEINQKIVEAKQINDSLKSQIASASGQLALKKKITDGTLQVVSILPTSIARLETDTRVASTEPATPPSTKSSKQ